MVSSTSNGMTNNTKKTLVMIIAKKGNKQVYGEDRISKTVPIPEKSYDYYYYYYYYYYYSRLFQTTNVHSIVNPK